MRLTLWINDEPYSVTVKARKIDKATGTILLDKDESHIIVDYLNRKLRQDKEADNEKR